MRLPRCSGRSERTVGNNISNILRKLPARNRAEAIVEAVRDHIVSV
ncbi:MAG: LuxR C-terminal-related transcriptional regulator [Chloroflexota bacterium]